MMQADPQPVVPAKAVTELPRTTSQVPAPAAPRQYGLFLPNLLTGLALVAWLAFQAFQQYGEHEQLAAVDANLVPQEQAAQKVRSSLEAVATATAKLAGEGNANAQVVVEQLRKRGVTINPNGTPKPQ